MYITNISSGTTEHLLCPHIIRNIILLRNPNKPVRILLLFSNYRSTGGAEVILPKSFNWKLYHRDPNQGLTELKACAVNHCANLTPKPGKSQHNV